MVDRTTTFTISVYQHFKVVSLNSVHGKMYSVQHYWIKFVSDLRHVSGILRVSLFPLTHKTDLHDIIEILLKVALNTINKPNKPSRG